MECKLNRIDAATQRLNHRLTTVEYRPLAVLREGPPPMTRGTDFAIAASPGTDNL
jgi:hypothetical protein